MSQFELPRKFLCDYSYVSIVTKKPVYLTIEV